MTRFRFFARKASKPADSKQACPNGAQLDCLLNGSSSLHRLTSLARRPSAHSRAVGLPDCLSDAEQGGRECPLWVANRQIADPSPTKTDCLYTLIGVTC